MSVKRLLARKKTKLEDKSVKCVLLGYSSDSKTFRIYDPIMKKIHISRDVIFEDDKTLDWASKSTTEQVAKIGWKEEYDNTSLKEGEVKGNTSGNT
ncbi:hypothetical protein V2J09_003689 [Rumex salicifolius]